MNLASLIASFSTGSYAVTRTERATIHNGKVERGEQQVVTITASVSPASGADMRRLPEGRNQIATKAVYTTTQLYAGAQGGDFEADIITIDGASWEVQHVERWQDSTSGTVAYKCIVQTA